MRERRALIWILPLTMMVQPAAAAEAPASPATVPEFSANIAVGAEYDSNVSVEEVDQASSQSDYALTTDLGLGVQQLE